MKTTCSTFDHDVFQDYKALVGMLIDAIPLHWVNDPLNLDIEGVEVPFIHTKWKNHLCNVSKPNNYYKFDGYM